MRDHCQRGPPPGLRIRPGKAGDSLRGARCRPGHCHPGTTPPCRERGRGFLRWRPAPPGNGGCPRSQPAGALTTWRAIGMANIEGPMRVAVRQDGSDHCLAEEGGGVQHTGGACGVVRDDAGCRPAGPPVERFGCAAGLGCPGAGLSCLIRRRPARRERGADARVRVPRTPVRMCGQDGLVWPCHIVSVPGSRAADSPG
jgi:hypothetical protein